MLDLGRSDLLAIFSRYWLETIIGVAVIGALGYALIIDSYTVSGGGFLYASLISYLLCFALTSFFLNRQRAKFFDRVFLSILSMLSGIILFEIVYHYGFGISQPNSARIFRISETRSRTDPSR